MKEILLIEDNLDLANEIINFLGKKQYNFQYCRDGLAGLRYATRNYDLIIMDIGLPRLNGYEILRQLREDGIETPILMLTEKSAVSDIVHGISQGADAYVPKPFNIMELKARIDALLKRPPRNQADILQVGALKIDRSSGKAFYHQRLLKLRKKEFELLLFFLKYPNQVFTRAHIMNRVWAADIEPTRGALDVHISKLRSKLGHTSKRPCPLKTVHGVGFKLVV